MPLELEYGYVPHTHPAVVYIALGGGGGLGIEICGQDSCHFPNDSLAGGEEGRMRQFCTLVQCRDSTRWELNPAEYYYYSHEGCGVSNVHTSDRS